MPPNMSHLIFNNQAIMKYITFNPYYVLKPDDGRTLIMAKLLGRNLLKGVDDSFTNVIHPIYAMILSYIDGREYNDCINNAANDLEVPKELVEGFDISFGQAQSSSLKKPKYAICFSTSNYYFITQPIRQQKVFCQHVQLHKN